MFAFAIVEHDSGRVVLARDRLGIKPLYLDERPGLLRFASTLQALLAGGGVDTSHRPRRRSRTTSASTRSCRRRARSSPASRKLPPATVRVIEADGTSREHVYWAPVVQARPGRADWSEARLAGGAARGAPHRGRAAAWSPTCRSACCSPAASTRASSSRCSPRPGQSDLATFSIGFDSAGGESGDEFEYSDLVARTLRHRPPPHPDRLRRGCCPASTRRSRR